MDKRSYNILFHLHTVSGIVISVVLFVIFFAGSFSFFRDDIVNWERNHTVNPTENIEMDYDAAFDSLESKYNLYSRDLSISKHYVERRIGINLSVPKDTILNTDQGRQFFYLDTENYETSDYVASYSLGEFLYRLHFLAQIPYPAGYYLSGFTALFFLFAIITGILIHWDKIVSNFYLFRPWSKLKTLWTDAHTALGTIGLPFQFVYAVTGAFFMIKALLIAPSVFALYNGDQGQLYDDLGYGEPTFLLENQTNTAAYSLNDLIEKTRTDWPDFDVNHVHVFNYGDANMHVSIEGEMNRNSKFTGLGKRIYKISSGEIVDEKSPLTKSSYLDGVKNALYRLHYGDYGGYALKTVSFVLGIISCFVIISGIMIWLVARDKKNIPEKRRRFNRSVALIYMAICLSMYPVTAASFIAVKVFSPASQEFIYQFYFITWLFLTILFILKRDMAFISKYTLLSGSIIGLLIPIANGVMTGNWIWISLVRGNLQLLVIDTFWILVSTTTLLIYFKIRNKEKSSEANI
ncbi:PepSY domain-containing protein [Reichenbachiella agarivorans]|uniref:PepSY domain-containing protein n=1 Tax=Reichenbachiella agarivorans TaxID=2979464 RepID=A0ABY6CPA8_9BACT|nr:PepSY-associated TM helix domain-containing protein [Reichenbachiella agarivorans]UXP32345.1 PepSY domain-containing protein [Reichenbachiella agarivorans]